MDRALLRCAHWRGATLRTTPARVAIAEWVELARTYSGDPARRLMNGVLGRVAERRRSPADGSPTGRPRHTAATTAPGGSQWPATYDRLKKIVVEQLGVDEDEVKPEASFVDDLNADSLDLVELIMSLEEEFGTEISDEDAEKIRTVQDAVDYIDEHAPSRGRDRPTGCRAPGRRARGAPRPPGPRSAPVAGAHPQQLRSTSTPTPPPSHNERLEFLGDAVVNLAISEALYARHPTTTKASCPPAGPPSCSTPGLARLADAHRPRRVPAARRGRGAARRPRAAVPARLGLRGAGRRALPRPRLEPTRDWLLGYAAPELDADLPRRALKSPKSRLQEHTQRTTGGRPAYRVVEATGPDHEKHFRIEVAVDGRSSGWARAVAPGRRDRGRGEALERACASRAAEATSAGGGRVGPARPTRPSAPARLLGLRLQGFKSFAERTRRRVRAGHQRRRRAERLRQEQPRRRAALGARRAGPRRSASRKCEDVIFAGSEQRAALGMADVTLVLDNADGLLPVDLASSSSAGGCTAPARTTTCSTGSGCG